MRSIATIALERRNIRAPPGDRSGRRAPSVYPAERSPNHARREPGTRLELVTPSDRAGLTYQGDQPIVGIDDLLRLDAEVVEAFEPLSKEALKAPASLVDSGLRGTIAPPVIPCRRASALAVGVSEFIRTGAAGGGRR